MFCIYPLRTSKYLDFKDWFEAIQIKSNSTPSQRKSNYILLKEELDTIIQLKFKMNSKRLFVDSSLLPDTPISPNWLICFLEGEGSFFVCSRWIIPVFSISKNNKNKKFFTGSKNNKSKFFLIVQLKQFVIII